MTKHKIDANVVSHEVDMEVLLLVWVIFAACIAALADMRGRSPIGYAALSFFLSPVIALIALLVTPNLVAEAEKERVRKEDEDRREEERRRQHERELESIKAIANSAAAHPEARPIEVPASSVADELEKLAALRDKGVLTDTEFSQLKMDLLASKA